ncbi:MAG: type II secretion system F family protein [Armatimonadota bacterium]
MPSYLVEVRAPDGELVIGPVTAPSLPSLAQRLRAEGQTLTRVFPQRQDRSLGAYWRRISEAELTTALRQLSTMLQNRVGAAEALALLSREAANPTLKALLLSVERAVREGDTLSHALSAYPRLFGAAQLRLLEAGESGHRLPEVLLHLADTIERSGQAALRVRTALIYPQTVGIFTLLMLAGTLGFVTPRFMELFRELGLTDEQLPLVTRSLQWAVTVLVPLLGALLPLALLAGAAAWWYVRRRDPVRGAYWKLRIPVVGALYHQLALLRLTRLLAALLRGGVPLLEALRLAGQGAGDPLLQAAMWDAIPHVAAGEPLSAAFSHAGILPPSFCGQVAAAEGGAALPDALLRASEWYGARVDYLAARVSALVEPFFIVLLALLAGWVALGMFAPLIAIIRGLSGAGF